ncbi:serine hydrolase domain-containing protein [Thalassotalea sp. 1_MG-2023]|uniref:serine hydrolase domain-containing protein n=1 Tax=Thalassotalea sp. 1_MG-2023 TaxID=3062680 RepID=UPI0026E329CF|nr:serine hydrolase domain-containing protein [Thalassotalea sp. 1_MG-2023]MDO6425824.1 serine hydrolase domain-containing protein [Thalassotalea sp. 1_MG-2023]
MHLQVINRILLAITLMMASQLSHAETHQQQFDRFLVNTMNTLDLQSSMAVAVVKNGNVIFQNTHGFADITKQEKATKNTLYYIASITKPIFSLAIQEVLSQSKYSANTTLKEMFPDVKFQAGIKAEQITIKHLLSHTSGLSDQYLTTAVSITGLHNQAQKLAMLTQLNVNEESPLGQFKYTNLGYNIVSLWYEKTFHNPWQTAVQQHVLTPMNMFATTGFKDEALRNNQQIAKPYAYFSLSPHKTLYLEKQDNTLHAAGGLYSTVSDMATFLRFQLNTKQIPSLSKNITNTQQLTTSLNSARGDFKRTHYCLGWYIGPYKHQTTYHHFGSFDGYRPHLSFMPEQGIGLVILNNEGMLNDKLTDIIADYIYGTLLKENDIEQKAASRIAKLADMAKKYRTAISEKEQSYLDKPLTLTLDKKAYTGTYVNPFAGEVNISLKEEKFFVTWGNLQATATAFNQPDILRIKLRPTRGQLIRFDVEQHSINTLTLDGITFNKK